MCVSVQLHETSKRQPVWLLEQVDNENAELRRASEPRLLETHRSVPAGLQLERGRSGRRRQESPLQEVPFRRVPQSERCLLANDDRKSSGRRDDEAFSERVD